MTARNQLMEILGGEEGGGHDSIKKNQRMYEVEFEKNETETEGCVWRNLNVSVFVSGS